MALNISASKEQLIVIDKNGNLKLINAGDKVLPGEILLNNGNENVSLDSNDIPEENKDIEEILNAIIDGEDPSLITEAPAAGEDSGSSLTTSIEIERTGESIIAETDFDTSSLEAIGLSKTQSLTLLEQYKAYRDTGSFDNGITKDTKNSAISNIVDGDEKINAVSENITIGNKVNITGLAVDPDGDDVTYALSQADIDAGLFEIDATTGVVTLIGNLDHEVADSHSITIIATSTDGSTSQESFDITVTDADGSTPGGGDTDNDVGPVTDSNATENTLSENAEVGSVVNITGLAVDPDGDEVSYKLSDADIAKGLFAIDATTGVVTLIGNLDHEVADSHSITIIATSTDGSTSQESFDIAVTDADGSTPGGGDTDNDVGPVTDSNTAENTLSENAEIGTVVNITGLATDPDGDEVTYALSEADIDAGLFEIDATTGVVTLIGNLDHEVADSHSITIIATSTDGSTSQESFDITVTDADGSTPGGGDTDNDVGPVTDSNTAENTLSENAEIGSVVNITGLATDPDGDEVSYKLSDADIAKGLFAIDATTGVVTLIGNLDHEVADSHSITIIATSTDGSISQESFDITVTDADGSTPGGGDTDNDVGPVTDSNAAENTLSENAEVGSVVNITGLAVDPDGDEVSYKLSDADIAKGLFAIDATTGVVTLIGNLDHEVADSHSITIIATSTDGSTSQESFDITVTDADGSTPGGGDTDNDVGPVTDSNAAENTLSENAEIGSVVNITGLATDPDGDEVSYKLSDADIAKGLFAIDATTGVVTLIGNLDHEVADSHSITIIATSTDGSTSQESFDIAVTDADGSTPGGGDTDNDVGPVTDSNAAENTLSENAEIGTVVNITGLATDPDGDEVTYALSQADIDAGLFDIDATTGVVTLIGNLDHEVADSHSITIIATSTDGSISQESFDIAVTDADGSTPGGGDTDNDVGPVTDSNAVDNTISENAEIGTVVNITGLAVDPDGDEVSYKLSDADIAKGLFAIDATTGVVTLIGNLDHEVADSHSITIIATSTDGSTSQESFDITVTDADGSTPGGGDTDNDVGPVTDSNAADNTLSENAEIGSVVNITGLATDPDGDEVTYALSEADIDAGLFDIDATTGVVTLIGNLDHEVADSHSITIIATSTDGSISQESFDIAVTDADGSTPGGGDTDNDVGPVTDSNAVDNTISENAEIGTVVNITGLAVDPDGDEVSYKLSDADIAKGLFAIDAITGVVTLIGNLDHEVADSHSITIIATSTDGSTSQESFDITVTDADGTTPGGGDTDNDVGPVTDSNAADNTISENAEVGSVVNITGLATDPDGDEVSYKLSDADIAKGLFAIDATTGVVTLIGNLDHEVADSHSITIIATSTDGSTSQESFDITVTDADGSTPGGGDTDNDVGPVTDSNAAENTLSENAEIGSVVNITGLATDPDGDEVTYALSQADIDAGLFEIDATTGVVTLIGNLDHEVADSHSITIIATSTDGSTSQESFDITVTDADGTTPGAGDTDNDVGPVTDSNAAENILSENAEIGTVVNITGLATDPDGDDVTYALSQADIDAGLFEIDATTGVVTLIGNLDHDTADSHSITIIATSTDGSTSQESFDITVTDADGTTPGGGDTDNDVGPVTDSNAAENTLSENAEVGSVVNITGLAVDPDGDEVSYKLSDADIAKGLFAIDATTGVVTLIGNLDHEVADSHSITIIATSTDGSTSQESFDITVTDADGSTPGGGDTDNDVGPVTDSNTAENTLSENAEIGTVVNITGLATDPDGDEVSYKLSDADIAKGLFAIDATTGVVTLIGNLDHDTADSHSITIIATSTDGSTSQESFDITVTDADGTTPGGGDTDNDVGPVTDSNAAENTLSENAEVGSVVNITGLAVDPDGDEVSYKLSDADIAKGLFAIDATTGVVTLIGNLDHEVADSHSITIIATSTDGSTSQESFDITVTDADGSTPGGGDTDNDVGSVTDSNAADNTISENAEVGSVVNITGLAVDPDGDEVSYKLSDADIAKGLFAIDATTGVVTLIGNLDHEVADSHSITIIATSTDGSTSQESFDIAVTDIDEIPPNPPTITLDIDSGKLGNDFLTNDGSFTVTPSEDGNTVEYFVNGEWTTDAPIATEGANSITVRETDAAGNVSGSSTLDFVLDTQAPNAPTITLDTDSGISDGDLLTNDGSFTVAPSEDGNTVEYFVNGEWTTDAPIATEGANSITVRETDAAGNVSGSNTLDFVLDTKAPNAPTITLDADSGISDGDLLTNDGSFTVTPNEVGNTVEYQAADGSWSTTPPAVVEGGNSITVRETDAAGNVSGSNTLDFVLDTQAPSAPIITLDTDSGKLGNDFLTNDGSFTVTPSEVGNTVEYQAADGSWSITPPAVVEGDNSITVRETDAAGNVSGSNTLDFVLDTQAPNAPTITLDTDSGISDGDLLTNDGSFTVTPSEVGNTVEYQTTDGSWSTTPLEVVEGDNSITVREIDAAGNVSGSNTLDFVLDTQAPNAPTITLDVDSGISDGDLLTNDGSFTVTPSEDGNTVEYFVNGAWTTDAPTATEGANSITVRETDAAGNVSGSNTLDFVLDTQAPNAPTITLDTDSGISNSDLLTNDGSFTVTPSEVGNTVEYQAADGSWSTIPPAVVEGDNSITVRETDAAGNVSGSNTLDFVLDTQAPSAPIITLDTDSGKLGNDFLTNDGSFTVTPSEVGNTVEYQAADGSWSITPPAVVEGDNSITVRETDAAGNVSGSNTLDFVLDTQAPNAPTITLDTDSGISDGDLLTNDGSFTVTPSEVGNTVEYQTTDGSWSTTPLEVVEGDNSITVREIDAAGNVSGSNTLDFVLDTQAPNAPTITLDVDSGISDGDLLTNDGSFTVTPSEDGNTVEYFVNGAWTTDAPTATEGANSITVRETDAAGNVSGSNTLDFVLDTQAPNAPTITLDTDSGISNSDLLTNDGSFTVTPSEVGNTVEYQAADGSWSTIPPAVVEGDNSITVRETDAAGNVSGSNTLDFVLDTQAPSAPIITLDTDSGKLGNDFLTNDGSFTVTPSEVGNTVEYQAADGSWSITPPAVVEGDNSITVRETDAAGNVSGSNTLDFVLDTQAPNAPTITLDVDSGISDGDLLTNDGSFTVTPSEDGNTVEYFVNGAWTTDAPTATEGANSITVRETDAAGNASGSNTLDFVLDTKAPNAPTITLDADSGISNGDLLTNDGSFTVTPSEVGNTVEYQAADGSWSTTPPAVVEGDNLITVRETDAAGNVSGSNTLDFVLDTQAPNAPTITLDVDSGISNGDLLTNDGSFTVTPSEVGNTVEYQAADGSWSTTPPVVVEGNNSITVRETDAAGNVSGSNTLDFVLDTQAPNAPTITLDTDSGKLGNDFLTNDGSFTVTPSEVGNIVEYQAADGSWSTTPPVVVEGNNSITVRETDAAGNVSGSNTLDFVLDTQAPNAPIITLDTDSGKLGDDFLTNNGSFTVTPSEVGNTVEYQAADGSWSTTPPVVVEGDNSITVRETDAAGNVSGSNTLDFVLDTQAPNAPTITLDVDSGISNGDLLTNDGSFTVTPSEVGNTVEYQAADGSWSTTPPAVVEGNNSITVRETDAAGNVSGSNTLDFVLDTSANAGSVIVDNITEDDVINASESGETIMVSGTAIGGDISKDDVVTMIINGQSYETTVNQDGSWSVAVEGSDLAADTEFEVSVSSSDDAGNIVESKVTSLHTVDTQTGTDGAAPTVVITEDSSPNDGLISASELVGDIDVSIGLPIGALEGEIITVSDGNTTKEITLTAAHLIAGTITTTFPSPGEGNEIKVTATLTDKYGNESETGEDVAVIDTLAEGGAVTVANITEDDVINASESGETIIVTGTAIGGDISKDDVVTMIINGQSYETVVNQDGTWSAEVAGSDLAEDTEFEVVVKSSDDAGNTVESKVTSTHTVDTDVLTETDGDGNTGITSDITDATNSGSNDDTITNDATPDITGVTEAGAKVTITYRDASDTLRTATSTASANGVYTIAILHALAEGSNLIDIVAVDSAGNTVSTTQDVTVDTKVLTETVGDGDLGITSDITDNTNTGSNSDTVTNNTTPDITGVTEAGAKVTITYTDKDGVIHTTDEVTANQNGEYTISLPYQLNEGANALTVTAIDIAGNKTEVIQDVTINADPIANDFDIQLVDDISTQFSFDAYVSDLEDDENDTDNKFVDITITDSPEFGTLYVVDGDIRTEITSSTILTESDQIEYVLDGSINDDLSFNAQEDFAPNYSNGSVNSFTLASGVIISGGQFTGDSPDNTSTLTPETLYYDNVAQETGLGVGNSEIDVKTKDYVEIDFSNVGSPNTTEVVITEVNMDFGSVWGNYSENSSADAKVQVLLFKDGVLVGESPYTFDDESNGIYDGSGEFTANIQLDSGFDQIRVYTIHGEGSTSSNSNLTLQGVEVVDAMVSEDIHYQATDSDDAIDTGVITISTDSTDKATNNAPIVDNSVFSETYEDVAIPLNLSELLISDLDGDDVTLTNITVDPAFGSLELIFNGNEVIGATFTPVENKHFDSNSPVEFTVTVSDGHKTSTGTAEMVVNAQADKPTVSLVLGEPVITNSAPNFDTSDVEAIKEYFENGGTIPGVGNVTYNAAMVVADDGNNLIIGTPLGDNLIGDAVHGTGNDVFVGGGLNDSIYGGTGPLDSGIDAVIYSGSIDEYLITNQGGAHGGGVDHWVVTDTLGRDTGYDHTAPEDNGDQLYQIERLVFSDAIVELNPDGSYTIIQNVEIPLDLSASVTDLDGSESLESLVLSGLSQNAVILDENKQPIGTYDEATGNWILPVGTGNQTVDFSNLSIQVPKSESDFTLKATATAIEASNSDTSSGDAEATLPQDILVDQGGSLPTTLITLALDSSGSMGDVEVDDKERMQLVLESSIKLLEDIQNQPNSGTVQVQLIDFDNRHSDETNDTATSLGWYSVADAITHLQDAIEIEMISDPYHIGGGTDYSEAIYAILDGYSNDKVPNDVDLSNTNDVIYFISDGHNNEVIPADLLVQWNEFIEDKEVKAVGVINDGTNNPYLGGLTDISDNVIYIEDKELYTVLPQLKPTIGQQGALTGSLTGIANSELVIETSKINILKVIDQDGNVSSENVGINLYEEKLQLVTDYGNLLINKDGSYLFQPIDNPTLIDSGKSVTYELAYTVIDGEGVEHLQQATLNVSPSDETNIQINHSLSGSTNNDVVIGSDEDDVIFAHQGNDILIGGLGDDILVGGIGDDIFKWVDQGADSGIDTIKDFTKGEDLIDITEILNDDVHQNDLNDLLEHITISEDGDDLTLSITDDAGKDHTIVVEGGIGSFGLDNANFSNQAEILTKLLDEQLFKLDDTI